MRVSVPWGGGLPLRCCPLVPTPVHARARAGISLRVTSPVREEASLLQPSVASDVDGGPSWLGSGRPPSRMYHALSPSPSMIDTEVSVWSDGDPPSPALEPAPVILQSRPLSTGIIAPHSHFTPAAGADLSRPSTSGSWLPALAGGPSLNSTHLLRSPTITDRVARTPADAPPATQPHRLMSPLLRATLSSPSLLSTVASGFVGAGRSPPKRSPAGPQKGSPPVDVTASLRASPSRDDVVYLWRSPAAAAGSAMTRKAAGLPSTPKGVNHGDIRDFYARSAAAMAKSVRK